jgi:hypothetical protein
VDFIIISMQKNDLILATLTPPRAVSVAKVPDGRRRYSNPRSVGKKRLPDPRSRQQTPTQNTTIHAETRSGGWNRRSLSNLINFKNEGGDYDTGGDIQELTKGNKCAKPSLNHQGLHDGIITLAVHLY